MNCGIVQDPQSLGRERLTLLSQIERLQNSSDETTDVLNILITEYNEITTAYNQVLDASRTRSPDQLPTELWIKIIKEVAVSHWDWSYKILLILTLVSKKWAAVILETPSLWVSIGCPTDAEDFDAVISVQLTLSNPLPLSIRSRDAKTFVQQAAPLLSSHAHRIEDLDMVSLNLPLEHPLLSTESLTSLRSVSLEGGDLFTISQFFRRHLGIELPFVMKEDSELLVCDAHWEANNGKLTHLWLPLSETTPQRLNFVASVKNVEIEDTGHSIDYTIWEEELPSSRLGFQSLSLGGVPERLLQHIVGRCDTRLTCLSVEIKLSNLYGFLETLNGLSGLEDLSLRTIEDRIDEGGFKQSPAPLNLVNFTWVCGFSGQGLLDITPCLLWLFQAAPNMRRVVILGSGKQSVDPTIFNNLKHIFSLSTHEINYVQTTLEEIAIPSPDLRYMNMSGDAALFCKLRSGSVTYLCIEFDGTLDDAGEASEIPLLLDDEHWSSVTALAIPVQWSTRLVFGSIRLSKLRTLSIGHQSFAAALYRNMALRPEDLPLLEKIIVPVVVEWDIFIIMLERRLMAQSRGVSTLQKIVFQRAVSRPIRKIIIMNLRGLLVGRPSNYDLSLYANCDTILDPSIPGCMSCHLQQVYCPQPIVTTGSSLFSGASHLFTKYPEDEAELLATWESRFRQLWPIIQQNTGHQLTRAGSCPRSYQIELTRDSNFN
ncbi:SubName: Full=Uncharacterized protein {ECO:0000313/EMBL:CCA70431.1} [Serendipita indica DSM 11827]|nr:SubName: Full=Uncharacterized protein {ECO:0000313/EMBL:CCA70431.1} [Serendipita indica DSM 11827]